MQVTLDMLTPIASPVATKQVENKVTSTKPRKPEQSIKQTNTISASKSIAQKQTTDKSIKETQPLDTTAVDSQPPGTATAETTTTTEALSDEQRRSSLNQLLTQALAKHFHYPMLARKRGWQGEVLLAFTLSTSGAITDARIAHGSGYSSLDHAALKSLNLVAHIGEQLTQELNFELPVIYRLNGG